MARESIENRLEATPPHHLPCCQHVRQARIQPPLTVSVTGVLHGECPVLSTEPANEPCDNPPSTTSRLPSSVRRCECPAFVGPENA